MRRKLFWGIMALSLIFPLISGQGCAPPALVETPTDRVYRLCRPGGYSDDYIASIITAAGQDYADGYSYGQEMDAVRSGCDTGCDRAYYYYNDQVACYQTCVPCGEAIVSLYWNPTALKEVVDEASDLAGAPTPGGGSQLRKLFGAGGCSAR